MVLALTVVGLTGLASRIEAQTVQTLVQFTNSWRYDQTGRQLPANWMTSLYTEDAQWGPLSPGLLGFEPDTPGVYTAHAPILTPLTVSGSITTYYFRTTFTYAGSLNNVTLIGTNLVDDGCAIYLNGLRVGGVRIPAGYGALNAATFFGGGTEGALEVVTFTNVSALRVGANLLAVEVHQSGNPSSDIMFGMRLLAFIPSALSITNQPESQTVTVGDPLSLSVGVSGGPVAYRWFKDGTFILNATNATYSVGSVTTNNAGSYRVVVSNVVNVLTSAVATVTVISDTDGPHMVAAIIANATGGGTFATNTVNVLWDEPLNAVTAQNTNNYKLVASTNSNVRIPITRIIYTPTLGSLLTVDGTNANWSATGKYYLIVNNIADSRGNNVNPNSAIGVSVLVTTTNLITMADAWRYYDCGDPTFCDPTFPAIYRDATVPQWYATNYVINEAAGVWGGGGGIFYWDPNNQVQLCAGDTVNKQISFQNYPTLFRRTFMMPTNFGANATLKLRYIVDDGMVFYLNGKLIHTYNMPVGPYNENSKALGVTNPISCITNISIAVTNLLPGTNWLAAGVFQAAGADAESDTVFGLEMDGVTLRVNPAPTNYPPGTPTIVRSVVRSPQTNFFVLSWPETNYGYALMYSTNIFDYGYSYRNGAPISGNPGPNPTRRWYTNQPLWLQVSNQANPFTNPIPNGTTGPRRFYKLFREKLND